jgi:hypothetical protein
MSSIRKLAIALTLAVGVLTGTQAQACAKPLQQSGLVQIPAGMVNGVAYVQVPRGYRYVVEYVSASVRLQTASEYSDFNVRVWQGLSRTDHVLPSLPGYTPLDRVTSGPVKFYADPGTQVQVSVARGNASVAATGHYAISGCLLKAA